MPLTPTVARWLVAPMSAALLVLGASPFLTQTAAADASQSATLGSDYGVATDTPPEQALLDLTNADRARNGLPALQFDPQLLAIARARAASQVGAPELSHYDASGQLVFVQMLQSAQIGYSTAGENLARSSADGAGTAAQIEQALMNSPLHRENILDPAYSSVAIGAVIDPSGGITYAEIFRGS